MKKRIGKKAVTQLEVINDLKVCLVLSDGKLCAHNIKTLVKNVNMIDVKNAAMFCVDNASPYHICVAIKGKKRLQVFRYLWKEERFEQTKELNVPDNPLAVSWAGQTLCIAFKREYSLLDIDIENVRDVSVPLPTNPLILTVENSELLLSSNNNLGIFINFQVLSPLSLSLSLSLSHDALCLFVAKCHLSFVHSCAEIIFRVVFLVRVTQCPKTRSAGRARRLASFGAPTT